MKPTGAQRLLVLLRLDRGVHPGQPSAQALNRLNPTSCRLYALEGRPSVPPEQLLFASLLQAFDGIRLERLLLEQLHYNLMLRWFVGLSPDDAIWHPTTYGLRPTASTQRTVIGSSMTTSWGCSWVTVHGARRHSVNFCPVQPLTATGIRLHLRQSRSVMYAPPCWNS